MFCNIVMKLHFELETPFGNFDVKADIKFIALFTGCLYIHNKMEKSQRCFSVLQIEGDRDKPIETEVK
jgi:hypothetical protein